jgi:hypothetical protein
MNSIDDFVSLLNHRNETIEDFLDDYQIELSELFETGSVSLALGIKKLHLVLKLKLKTERTTCLE